MFTENFCKEVIPRHTTQQHLKTARKATLTSVFSTYLIPIKICAPLIFTHLACAKIKGSKFAQYESLEIRGRRKNVMNEKMANLQ